MLLNIFLVTVCTQLQYSDGFLRFDEKNHMNVMIPFGFTGTEWFNKAFWLRKGKPLKLKDLESLVANRIKPEDLTGVYFSPNKIHRRRPQIRGRKMKMDLMDTNPNFGQICFDPADLVKRTSRALFAKGQEPYRMGNLKFSVPLRSIVRSRETNVYVERLSLFGLSDFGFIEDAKSDEDGGCPVMYLKWGRLKAICTIVAELEGLKNTGEAEMRTEEPLYMRVRLAKSDTDDPQIEMSQVNDVTVEIQGLETTSEESMVVIRKELESTLKEAINSEVRNILTDFVQNSLLKQSASKLTYKMDEI